MKQSAERVQSGSREGAERAIAPFDCATYPQAIQVIKNLSTGLPARYEVKTLDVTGEYNLAYTIPFDRTDPAFTAMNAVAINPVDGMAYGVIRFNESLAEGERFAGYLVRFDENGVEFVAELPVYSVAGTFSIGGTFYYHSGTGLGNVMYSIENVAGLAGASSMDGNILRVPKWPPMAAVGPKFLGHDLVAVEADLLGVGTTDTYVLSLSDGYVDKPGLLTIVRDAGADSQSWVIGAMGGPAVTDGWGAGWNFNGEVFFSANSGDGVYQVPLGAGMIDDMNVLLKKVVDETAVTKQNDGMNCMQLEDPFLPPDPNCGAGFVEVPFEPDGSCPAESFRGV